MAPSQNPSVSPSMNPSMAPSMNPSIAPSQTPCEKTLFFLFFFVCFLKTLRLICVYKYTQITMTQIIRHSCIPFTQPTSKPIIKSKYHTFKQSYNFTFNQSNSYAITITELCFSFLLFFFQICLLVIYNSIINTHKKKTQMGMNE